MSSLLKLSLKNWTFMCLWILTMGTTRSLVYHSLRCFQWWDQDLQHGHPNTRILFKTQHLVPSSQQWRRLPRSQLWFDTTLDQCVSRYQNIHLYLWTTWVWFWTRLILLSPWTIKLWHLATILLGSMLLSMLWRWGRYTPDTILQTHSPNPWWEIISIDFTMISRWMDKENSGSHPR